jgi:hypothetical protein
VSCIAHHPSHFPVFDPPAGVVRSLRFDRREDQGAKRQGEDYNEVSHEVRGFGLQPCGADPLASSGPPFVRPRSTPHPHLSPRKGNPPSLLQGSAGPGEIRSPQGALVAVPAHDDHVPMVMGPVMMVTEEDNTVMMIVVNRMAVISTVARLSTGRRKHQHSDNKSEEDVEIFHESGVGWGFSAASLTEVASLVTRAEIPYSAHNIISLNACPNSLTPLTLKDSGLINKRVTG